MLLVAAAWGCLTRVIEWMMVVLLYNETQVCATWARICLLSEQPKPIIYSYTISSDGHFLQLQLSRADIPAPVVALFKKWLFSFHDVIWYLFLGNTTKLGVKMKYMLCDTWSCHFHFLSKERRNGNYFCMWNMFRFLLDPCRLQFACQRIYIYIRIFSLNYSI